MVWNNEKSALMPQQLEALEWAKPPHSERTEELLEEAFDALVYLDEKLLALEYALDNEDLVRRVLGALIRLYGLFWGLKLHHEFRMVAQAKAMWSYILHGALPLEREMLHHLSGLGRSLEGHLVSFSQRTQPVPEVAAIPRLESRRFERDEQWANTIQQHLSMEEHTAMQRISFALESAEQWIPHELGQINKKDNAASFEVSPEMDVSSLYSTLRELGSQMRDLREQLGSQASSVVKQSLSSMQSLYRFLRRGLRTLYSRSDNKIGLHGLIFSYQTGGRERLLLLPTSHWLDILPGEQANLSHVGDQRYMTWAKESQPIPVYTLEEIHHRLVNPAPPKEQLSKESPQWLRDTLEIRIDMMAQETDSPFVEEDLPSSSDVLGFCVVVAGLKGTYALHVESIVGEMMVALLETTEGNSERSPVRAVGLLPDSRMVQVMDAPLLERLISNTDRFDI